MKKRVFIILVLLVIIFVSSCTPQQPTSDYDKAWLDVEFTDINSGNIYKINDFSGQKVLLETFAVWCPLCKQQQQEIQKMRAQESSIIHISLDIDPNEDEAYVKEYLDENGFDWIYGIAPVEFSQALINDFGNTVVNAPDAPMILICEDQDVRYLRRGVKKVDELLSEVEKGC